ncbi:MAG: sulfur oxidation c-type cytochrome SoxA [Pseudomonadota bacterium]
MEQRGFPTKSNGARGFQSKLRPLAIMTAGFVAFAGAGITYDALQAEPNDNELVIEGQKMVTKFVPPEGGPLDVVYSGWRFRNAATQQQQMDDFENPAFPLVDLGQELWTKVDGAAGKSCASCHDKAEASMKGVRAEMPKYHKAAGKPQAMEQHVNHCRTDRMQAEPWKWESNQMLGMTAYIGLQSRGMPVAVKTDGDYKAFHDLGKKIYYTRVGQLDMSCAGCHEANYGKMIRADHLSQGQINGFPLYRSKWQKVGSAHRRFKGCMKNIRAKPYKVGSDEFVALELYVASRGLGLSVETPAVRN